MKHTYDLYIDGKPPLRTEKTPLESIKNYCIPYEYASHEEKLKKLTEEQLKIIWCYMALDGECLDIAIKQVGIS